MQRIRNSQVAKLAQNFRDKILKSTLADFKSEDSLKDWKLIEENTESPILQFNKDYATLSATLNPDTNSSYIALASKQKPGIFSLYSKSLFDRDYNFL